MKKSINGVLFLNKEAEAYIGEIRSWKSIFIEIIICLILSALYGFLTNSIWLRWVAAITSLTIGTTALMWKDIIVFFDKANPKCKIIRLIMMDIMSIALYHSFFVSLQSILETNASSARCFFAYITLFGVAIGGYHGVITWCEMVCNKKNYIEMILVATCGIGVYISLDIFFMLQDYMVWLVLNK